MATSNQNSPTKKNSQKTATNSQPNSSGSPKPEGTVRAENQPVPETRPEDASRVSNEEADDFQTYPSEEYWEDDYGEDQPEVSPPPREPPTTKVLASTSTQGQTATAGVAVEESPPAPSTEAQSKGPGEGGGKPPSGGKGGGSQRGGGTIGGQMSFLEHLEELRQRLVYAVLWVVVAFLFCFYFHEQIYDYLAIPVTEALRSFNPEFERLVYTNPMEPFNIYLKVSFVAAIFVSSPMILYQLWLFISPGLYRHEKRYVLPFVTLTSGLFMSGGYFAYRVVLPPVFQFLFEFGGDFQPFIHINEYFSLASTLLVGMGLVFELPVIILILSIFGIVTPRFLLKNIRYAILIIAILAAALAPTPDWVTLMLFSLPMLGLYFLSIGLCFLVQLRRKKKSSQEGAK